MRVVVLGAAGQLGREVVNAFVSRGHAVVAVVRRPPAPPFASPVHVHQADARNKAQVQGILTPSTVVVNAIGAGTLRKNDVESSTSAIAVAAAQDVGVE